MPSAVSVSCSWYVHITLCEWSSLKLSCCSLLVFVCFLSTSGFFVYKLVKSLRDKEKAKEEKKKLKQQRKEKEMQRKTKTKWYVGLVYRNKIPPALIGKYVSSWKYLHIIFHQSHSSDISVCILDVSWTCTCLCCKSIVNVEIHAIMI